MRQGRAKPGAMQAMPLSLWSIGSLSCISTVRSGPSIAVGCSAQGMVAGLSEGCIDSSWSRIIWRIQREEGAVAELKTISSAASAPVSFMDSRFLCHDLASSLNSSRVACVGDRGDPWSLNASRLTSWFSPASLARAEQHCIPVRRLSTRRFWWESIWGRLNFQQSSGDRSCFSKLITSVSSACSSGEQKLPVLRYTMSKSKEGVKIHKTSLFPKVEDQHVVTALPTMQ